MGGASKLVDNLGINPQEPVLVGCVIGAGAAEHRLAFLSLEALLSSSSSELASAGGKDARKHTGLLKCGTDQVWIPALCVLQSVT